RTKLAPDAAVYVRGQPPSTDSVNVLCAVAVCAVAVCAVAVCEGGLMAIPVATDDNNTQQAKATATFLRSRWCGYLMPRLLDNYGTNGMAPASSYLRAARILFSIWK